MSILNNPATGTLLDNINAPIEHTLSDIRRNRIYIKTPQDTAAYKRLKRNMVFGFENEKTEASLFKLKHRYLIRLFLGLD